MATHFNILAWKIHGQRRLAVYSPPGHKEPNMTEQIETANKQYYLIYFSAYLLAAIEREPKVRNSALSYSSKHKKL